MAASSDVSTDTHEHTIANHDALSSVKVRAPSSSSSGGGSGGVTAWSGGKEEGRGKSPAIRSAGGGGGDDVWSNRSVNFGVSDEYEASHVRDSKGASSADMFLSASAKAECRNLQPVTTSMTASVGAKGVPGEVRDYDIYDVNRTINKGSFRSSSSYTAGEMIRRGNDQIYDVIGQASSTKTRGAAGMKEESNKLGGVNSSGNGNNGSFREEKALVQGYDMNRGGSAKGNHPQSPSIGRAGSKEGMNIGMNMNTGMGGQVVGAPMPLEQKVNRHMSSNRILSFSALVDLIDPLTLYSAMDDT